MKKHSNSKGLGVPRPKKVGSVSASKSSAKKRPGFPTTPSREETSLLRKIKALGTIDDEQRNAVTCSLIGHSRIITTCFGYIYCARCSAQIGDALGGIFSRGDECVIVGHDCPTCRKAAKDLTWKDTLFAPDPFPKPTRKK